MSAESSQHLSLEHQGNPQPFGAAIMWPHFSSPPLALTDLDMELDTRALQRDHVIYSKPSSYREYVGDTWA